MILVNFIFYLPKGNYRVEDAILQGGLLRDVRGTGSGV